MNHQLLQLLNKKIVYLDGAMGTMIQQYYLKEEDFKGDMFKKIKPANILTFLTS